MPIVLSPEEAAEIIRDDIDANLNHDLPPEVRHQHTYVSQVCAALNIDASSAAMVHVTDLLHRHDIVPHARQEYPKWVTRLGEKKAVLVYSAEEEQAAMGG